MTRKKTKCVSRREAKKIAKKEVTDIIRRFIAGIFGLFGSVILGVIVSYEPSVAQWTVYLLCSVVAFFSVTRGIFGWLDDT